MIDFRCKICGGDLEIIEKANGIVRCKNCLNKFTFDINFIEEVEKQIPPVSNNQVNTIVVQKVESKNKKERKQISKQNRGIIYYVLLDLVILLHLISAFVFIVIDVFDIIKMKTQWALYLNLFIAIIMTIIGHSLIKHKPESSGAKCFFGFIFLLFYIAVLVVSVLTMKYYFV